MNVRQMANRLTSRVNPNLQPQWFAFAGYDTAPNGKTTALYATPVAINAQVQALTAEDLQHTDGMNLSTLDRAVYANAQLNAIDRDQQLGGDLLVFEGSTWLVTAILEKWTTAGWCKVAVTKQNGG